MEVLKNLGLKIVTIFSFRTKRKLNPKKKKNCHVPNNVKIKDLIQVVHSIYNEESKYVNK